VVSFGVVEGEAPGNWYGKFPGAVRPKLRWLSEAIGSGDLAVTQAKNSVTSSPAVRS